MVKKTNYKKQARKIVSKGVKVLGRKIRGRYFKGKGFMNPNMDQIAKDVMTLKGIVNAEKKNVDSADATSYNFAQNNGAFTGSNVLNILPNIAQGTTEDTRNGDSIKLNSAMIQFEITGPTYADQVRDMHYKILIIKLLDPTRESTTNLILTGMFENNTFSNVIDYNSNRNYQKFDHFQILATRKGVVKLTPNDKATSAHTKQIKIPLKLGFHVRYDKGTTNVLRNGIYAVFLADTGDTTTANRINFQWSSRFWFYDN